MDNNFFEKLSSINVNDKTEKKKTGKKDKAGNEETLTYLSWAWAWAEVKKVYPDANYAIWKDESGHPYTYDEKTGYMVYTTVTIEGITHEMWLPVMDGKNKAMKSEPYEYTTKYGKNTVEAATMFDVNKTIMRCLTKNLAMFGLGLYIFAGEDLPETEVDEKATKSANEYAELKIKFIGYINRHKYTDEQIEQICNLYKVKSLQDMNYEQIKSYIAVLEQKGKTINE